MTAPSFSAWWDSIEGWEPVNDCEANTKQVAKAAWTARGEALRPYLHHLFDCEHVVCLHSHDHQKQCACSCGLTERSAG